MTKNGLKWPKFGTFIVIKWFYEKIEKKILNNFTWRYPASTAQK